MGNWKTLSRESLFVLLTDLKVIKAMAEEDRIQMVDIQPQVITEKSPFVEEGEVVTTDDLIEELFRHRTWKYNLLIMSLTLTCLAGPLVIFITAFAGELGDVVSLY